MDNTPVFNVDVFSDRVKTYIISTSDVMLYHYIDTRDILERKLRKFNPDGKPTKISSLYLETEIAAQMELEKSNPELQPEDVSNPIAGALALGNQDDYESYSGGSSEDPGYRRLSIEQRKKFGNALKQDMNFYFKYLPNVGDKLKIAERILQVVGVGSSKHRAKFFHASPAHRSGSPLTPTLDASSSS